MHQLFNQKNYRYIKKFYKMYQDSKNELYITIYVYNFIIIF